LHEALSDAGAFASAEWDEVVGPCHFTVCNESLRAELAGSFPVFFAIVDIVIVEEDNCPLFDVVS
jgi:hypothetical protein